MSASRSARGGAQRRRPIVSPSRGATVRSALPLAALVALAGCQPALDRSVLTGDAAYKAIPVADPDAKLADYTIGSNDMLDITVFQEPDLSPKNVKVDSGGRIIMPLIGTVTAAGKSSVELSAEIAQLLSAKYLQNPQVTVTVTAAMSQRVAVEGSVNEAGVFQLNGRTTLLEALAMAKGTSRTAALSQVVVFRTISGQRNAAVFNISDIRRGAAADPEVLGNDLIVVGFSNLKAGWRDFLSASPLLNFFRPF